MITKARRYESTKKISHTEPAKPQRKPFAQEMLGVQRVSNQTSHSTLPFESLRVLSPSAVSSGPNGIVEGLMALSKIEGLVSPLADHQARRCFARLPPSEPFERVHRKGHSIIFLASCSDLRGVIRINL
jgi:hypothetical protein